MAPLGLNVLSNSASGEPVEGRSVRSIVKEFSCDQKYSAAVGRSLMYPAEKTDFRQVWELRNRIPVHRCCKRSAGGGSDSCLTLLRTGSKKWKRTVMKSGLDTTVSPALQTKDPFHCRLSICSGVVSLLYFYRKHRYEGSIGQRDQKGAENP